MDAGRVVLAVTCTAGVTPADWALLETRPLCAIEDGLGDGAAGLCELLGRRVGPVDWNAVDRQFERLAAVRGALVTHWDDHYPARLREVGNAPPLLFVRGDARCLDTSAIALVGTRAPSSAGVGLATRLSRALSLAGVTVVSGLARGIDTAAHRGALEAGGLTVAVLGTGVDVAYPRENADLLGRVTEHGCVVSEQLCGTPGTAHVFPKRNRIISGLSLAVVVVEGGIRSGALITARWALDQGREVGAVPGFPGDFRSAGPNQLLRDGAFVVESVTDVLAAVPGLCARAAPATGARGGAEPGAGDRDEARVLGLLGRDTTADEVAAATGLETSRVQEILVRLEIDGRVTRDLLGRFARV